MLYGQVWQVIFISEKEVNKSLGGQVLIFELFYGIGALLLALK